MECIFVNIMTGPTHLNQFFYIFKPINVFIHMPRLVLLNISIFTMVINLTKLVLGDVVAFEEIYQTDKYINVVYCNSLYLINKV